MTGLAEPTMRLHRLVCESTGVTLEVVDSIDDLKDAYSRYLAGTVNVTRYVYLYERGMHRLPVRFGTVGGDFDCTSNRLTSLEGAPRAVGGDFHCSSNRLTSLEGAPSTTRDFYCGKNQLTSLAGVHRALKRINGKLYIEENPIETGGISLVLVEGLTRIVADQPAFEIINEYLGQGMKGMLRCQEALHDAGYEEYAKS